MCALEQWIRTPYGDAFTGVERQSDQHCLAALQGAQEPCYALPALLEGELMNEVLKSFQRQPDGTWVCTRYTTFDGPSGRMQVTPGSAFARGTTFMGADLAEWLDRQLATFGPRSEH